MVEPLAFRSAFAEHLDTGRYGRMEGAPGVRVAFPDLPGMALVLARNGQTPGLVASFGLPEGRKRVVRGARAFIGLGPGQWLATGEAGLAAALAQELAGRASISEQSHGRAVLQLRGPHVRTALAKGVPVDLHPAVFGPGDAAATLVAMISVWLWQVDDAPAYDLAVPRSMAGSFADWLKASAGEFGMEVE